MIRRVLFIASFFISCVLSAQENLVPNGNFEDTAYCPDDLVQIDAAEFWYSPTLATPDYYNSCSLGGVGIPQNYFGNQIAHSGQGYAGIASSFDSLTLNYREYIQVQLSQPLIAGKDYYVEVYFSKADSFPLALKEIGLCVSNVAIGGAFDVTINQIPQVTSIDFSNDYWTKVEGVFIANGGEEFLTIGYFKDNNIDDSLNLNFQTSFDFYLQNYIYVDDVLIVDNDFAGIINSQDKSELVVLNIDNLNETFNISINDIILTEIYLLDMNGRCVRSFDPEQNMFSTTGLSPGIFILKASSNSRTVLSRKIIIQ